MRKHALFHSKQLLFHATPFHEEQPHVKSSARAAPRGMKCEHVLPFHKQLLVISHTSRITGCEISNAARWVCEDDESRQHDGGAVGSTAEFSGCAVS